MKWRSSVNFGAIDWFKVGPRVSFTIITWHFVSLVPLLFHPSLAKEC